MFRKIAIVLLAFLFLVVPAYATAKSVPDPAVNSRTAAGYQVTGSAGDITRIKGSWVVPTLQCSVTPNANSSMSVMLDGMNGQTDRMQIGTIAACVGGIATYRAFVNMLPNIKVVRPTLTIKAGDTIEAQGKWSPQTHGWHAQIIDETTKVTQRAYASAPTTFTPPLSSGSFIVANSGTSPLTDFGQVGFGKQSTGVKQTCIVTAVVSGSTTVHVISLGSLAATYAGFTLNQITMVDSRGSPMASPGPLSSDGGSFTVAWEASS